METLQKIIFNDINNVISKLKSNKSISMYPYLCSDLDELYDLCKDLGIDNYPTYEDTNINLNYKKYNDNIIEQIISSYFIDYDLIKSLILNVNAFYEDYPIYKHYNDFPKIKLNLNEIVLIVSDFLKNLDIRYYEMFKNIYNSKKLIVSSYSDDSNYGLTYNGFSFSPYIVFENDENILTALTIAHEIAHAFSTSLIRNIAFKKQNNRYLVNSIEICSYTIELFFIDYLKKIHFFEDDITRLINEYNHYFSDSALYCKKHLLDDPDNIEITDELNTTFRTFYGKSIATYLFSLNDKEKTLYLIDRISIESCEKILSEIINDNNMDFEDIKNFKSGKKLLKKLSD